ncbi:MAG: hypothetical protein ACM3Q2_07135 [Syntrophothermus sp.]
MKKSYILLLSLALAAGCDKIPTDSIDNTAPGIQALGVNAPQKFTYTNSDSSFTASVRLKPSSGIKSVWADIYDSDGKKLNSNPIYHYDTGESKDGDLAAGDYIYSARIPMSVNNSNGAYTIQYKAEGTDNNSYYLAQHSFDYISHFNNSAPVISNLSAADTLDTSTEESFVVQIKVTDADGLNDIKEVYFELYYPNGNQTGTPKNMMYDDGNKGTQQSGDVTAGDGIYSFKGQLSTTIPKGLYKFVFHATDKSNATSNIITKFINIK